VKRALAVSIAALVAATPAAAAPTPPLDHEGRWFEDKRGRVVILRGFNMVYKVDSYRPQDTGFGADDARFLRRHGFNSIRLGIIYKGLEPDPPTAAGKPQYRKGYLRSIARTERVLARRGIFTLLDFHQDLYNERFQGEGWPDWQTIDDGVPSQPQQGFPANYLVNAGLQRAFDNFWANTAVEGRGLQDAYAEAWRRVAVKFRRKPFVMGYDLLNEPWPGSAFGPQACGTPTGCPVFDSTTLTEFSVRVLDAIRTVDPTTLVFYEPLVTFDFGADTSHGDTGDPNAGFSFHNYCLPGAFGGPGSGPSCEPLEEMVFVNAEEHAAKTGDVPFLTEYGATDDLETIERLVRLSDAHMASWQYWHYCDCADPTTAGPGVQALVVDPVEPPRGDNVKREKLQVLARPYPRAVAGTPRSFGFDPATRRFELDYSTGSPRGRRLDRRIDSEVFLPRIQYPDGYRVEVAGARVVSDPGSRVLRVERYRRARSVSLVVTPRP
jgi:endoglycosylceramidase